MNPLTQNIEFMSRDDAGHANQVILKEIIIETAAPRMPTPLLTASGALENVSLVLVNLKSECGLSGHSYLFSPNQSLLWSLVFGLWSLVFGLWSLVSGLWSMQSMPLLKRLKATLAFQRG